MIRGTTPTLIFKTNIELGVPQAIEVVIGQYGQDIMVFNNARCKVSGKNISLELTEEETLKLSSNSLAEVQIRIKKDNKIMASKVQEVMVNALLKNGVME